MEEMHPNRPNKRAKIIQEAVENAVPIKSDCILSLPPDMIICILSRLSVKTLMRIKSVCKQWHQLVSNPNFIEIHYDQFSRVPKTCSGKFLSLSNLTLGPSKAILGNPVEVFMDSCRGLVCVGNPLLSREIVLWNPAMNLWKTLPHSTWVIGNMGTVSLGFGGNVDDAAVGGYDYKVVRLLRFKGGELRTGVEVYSSKTDSWETIQVGFKFLVGSCANRVIFNGTPYWIALIDEKSRVAEGEGHRFVLLGFDCANMKFKIVPMPNLDEKMVTFVDWKGSLGGVVCTDNSDGWLESIDVWVYDDRESAWTRKESYGGLKLQVGRCINVSRSGTIFGSCIDSSFFLYNTEINHLAIIDLKNAWMNFRKIFPYEECLAFMQGMKPMVSCKEDCREENINTVYGFFISLGPIWGVGDIKCHYALGC